MPYGYPNFSSSDTSKVGSPYTRLTGPVLIGQTKANAEAVSAPHIVNVSTVPADMLVAVVTTFASTASVLVSTASPKGLVYISMSSADMIAAASTANAPVGLPGGASGCAIVWDSGKKTLAVYDPLTSAWLWPHQLSTVAGAGATIVFSASSS